jgi:hypothetical protein
MILNTLPKITRIVGGAKTLNSGELALDNYRVAAFVIDNPTANELTVSVKAKQGSGAAVAVPFLIKNIDGADYEQATADGKTVEDAGAVIAVVTADNLAHGEYDRVILSLASSDKNIPTVYALQTQPRYTDNE